MNEPTPLSLASLAVQYDSTTTKFSREKRQKRLILAPLLIRTLYKNVNGNNASQKYIKNLQLDSEKKSKNENEPNNESKSNTELSHSKSDQSLTYGEIVPSSFLQILEYTTSNCNSSSIVSGSSSNSSNSNNTTTTATNNMNSTTCSGSSATTTDTTTSRVFYDLGSGTGRAVICAAFSPSYAFTKVIGK